MKVLAYDLGGTLIMKTLSILVVLQLFAKVILILPNRTT